MSFEMPDATSSSIASSVFSSKRDRPLGSSRARKYCIVKSPDPLQGKISFSGDSLNPSVFLMASLTGRKWCPQKPHAQAVWRQANRSRSGDKHVDLLITTSQI